MGENWTLEIVKTLDLMVPILERIAIVLEKWGEVRDIDFPNVKVEELK